MGIDPGGSARVAVGRAGLPDGFEPRKVRADAPPFLRLSRGGDDFVHVQTLPTMWGGVKGCHRCYPLPRWRRPEGYPSRPVCGGRGGDGV